MEEEPGWKFEDAAKGGSLRARYSLQRKEIREEKWGEKVFKETEEKTGGKCCIGTYYINIKWKKVAINEK